MSHLRFYNVWHADSVPHRDQLIDVMRREATAFADQPGFLSLHAWASETDTRLIVEANWSTRRDFEAAVSNSHQTPAARQQMQTLATDTPAVFTLAFSERPTEGHSGSEEHDGVGSPRDE
jgi:heme-degrading monooxygenase HmoA